MLSIDLRGKVALVTGAGVGIGFGCAKRLVEAGAEVIVNDIRPEAAEEAAHQLNARAMVADVGDPQAVAQMAEQIGRLDVLVNNAGFDYVKPIVEMPLEDWDRVHGTHLRAMFLMIRAFAPRFVEGASVVNVASVHAFATEAGSAAYASTKAGIVGLTRSAAIDLGPKVRVNSVLPGYVETRLITDWLEQQPDPEATMRRVLELHPVRRIGRPEDIGNLVAFLASDLASYITGAAYVIDGGLTTQLPW